MSAQDIQKQNLDKFEGGPSTVSDKLNNLVLPKISSEPILNIDLKDKEKIDNANPNSSTNPPKKLTKQEEKHLLEEGQFNKDLEELDELFKKPLNQEFIETNREIDREIEEAGGIDSYNRQKQREQEEERILIQTDPDYVKDPESYTSLIKSSEELYTADPSGVHMADYNKDVFNIKILGFDTGVANRTESTLFGNANMLRNENFDMEKFLDSSQSTWSKSVNLPINFTGNIIIHALAGVIGTAAGTISAIKNWDITKLWDNEISHGFEEAQEGWNEQFTMNTYSPNPQNPLSNFFSFGTIKGIFDVASFVSSVVLVEFITAGFGTGGIAARLGSKALAAVAKTAARAEKMSILGKVPMSNRLTRGLAELNSFNEYNRILKESASTVVKQNKIYEKIMPLVAQKQQYKKYLKTLPKESSEIVAIQEKIKKIDTSLNKAAKVAGYSDPSELILSFNIINNIKKTASFLRSTTTSTFWMAGLETRGALELYDQEIERMTNEIESDIFLNEDEKNKYLEIIERSSFEDRKSIGQTVFFSNVVLLRASQMIQFPSLFGWSKGVGKVFPTNRVKNNFFNKVKSIVGKNNKELRIERLNKIKGEPLDTSFVAGKKSTSVNFTVKKEADLKLSKATKRKRKGKRKNINLEGKSEATLKNNIKIKINKKAQKSKPEKTNSNKSVLEINDIRLYADGTTSKLSFKDVFSKKFWQETSGKNLLGNNRVGNSAFSKLVLGKVPKALGLMSRTLGRSKGFNILRPAITSSIEGYMQWYIRNQQPTYYTTILEGRLNPNAGVEDMMFGLSTTMRKLSFQQPGWITESQKQTFKDSSEKGGYYEAFLGFVAGSHGVPTFVKNSAGKNPLKMQGGVFEGYEMYKNKKKLRDDTANNMAKFRTELYTNIGNNVANASTLLNLSDIKASKALDLYDTNAQKLNDAAIERQSLDKDSAFEIMFEIVNSGLGEMLTKDFDDIHKLNFNSDEHLNYFLKVYGDAMVMSNIKGKDSQRQYAEIVRKNILDTFAKFMIAHKKVGFENSIEVLGTQVERDMIKFITHSLFKKEVSEAKIAKNKEKLQEILDLNKQNGNEGALTEKLVELYTDLIHEFKQLESGNDTDAKLLEKISKLDNDLKTLQEGKDVSLEEYINNANNEINNLDNVINNIEESLNQKENSYTIESLTKSIEALEKEIEEKNKLIDKLNQKKRGTNPEELIKKEELKQIENEILNLKKTKEAAIKTKKNLSNLKHLLSVYSNRKNILESTVISDFLNKIEFINKIKTEETVTIEIEKLENKTKELNETLDVLADFESIYTKLLELYQIQNSADFNNLNSDEVAALENEIEEANNIVNNYINTFKIDVSKTEILEFIDKEFEELSSEESRIKEQREQLESFSSLNENISKIEENVLKEITKKYDKFVAPVIKAMDELNTNGEISEDTFNNLPKVPASLKKFYNENKTNPDVKKLMQEYLENLSETQIKANKKTEALLNNPDKFVIEENGKFKLQNELEEQIETLEKEIEPLLKEFFEGDSRSVKDIANDPLVIKNINKKLTESEEFLYNYHNNKITLEKNVEVLKKNIKRLERDLKFVSPETLSKINKLDETRKELEAVEEQIKEITIKKEGIAEEETTKTYNELKTKETELQESIKNQEKELNDYIISDESTYIEVNTHKNNTIDELTDLDAKLELLENKIKNFNDKDKQSENDIKKINGYVNDILIYLKKEKDTLSKLKEYEKEYQSWIKQNDNNLESVNHIKEKSKYEKAYKEYTTLLKEHKKATSDINKIYNKLKVYTVKTKGELNKIFSEYTKTYESYFNELKVLEDLKAEKETIDSKVDENNKTESKEIQNKIIKSQNTISRYINELESVSEKISSDIEKAGLLDSFYTKTLKNEKKKIEETIITKEKELKILNNKTDIFREKNTKLIEENIKLLEDEIEKNKIFEEDYRKFSEEIDAKIKEEKEVTEAEEQKLESLKNLYDKAKASTELAEKGIENYKEIQMWAIEDGDLYNNEKIKRESWSIDTESTKIFNDIQITINSLINEISSQTKGFDNYIKNIKNKITGLDKDVNRLSNLKEHLERRNELKNEMEDNITKEYEKLIKKNNITKINDEGKEVLLTKEEIDKLKSESEQILQTKEAVTAQREVFDNIINDFNTYKDGFVSNLKGDTGADSDAWHDFFAAKRILDEICKTHGQTKDVLTFQENDPNAPLDNKPITNEKELLALLEEQSFLKTDVIKYNSILETYYNPTTTILDKVNVMHGMTIDFDLEYLYKYISPILPMLYTDNKFTEFDAIEAFLQSDLYGDLSQAFNKFEEHLDLAQKDGFSLFLGEIGMHRIVMIDTIKKFFNIFENVETIIEERLEKERLAAEQEKIIKEALENAIKNGNNTGDSSESPIVQQVKSESEFKAIKPSYNFDVSKSNDKVYISDLIKSGKLQSKVMALVVAPKEFMDINKLESWFKKVIVPENTSEEEANKLWENYLEGKNLFEKNADVLYSYRKYIDVLLKQANEESVTVQVKEVEVDTDNLTKISEGDLVSIDPESDLIRLQNDPDKRNIPLNQKNLLILSHILYSNLIKAKSKGGEVELIDLLNAGFKGGEELTRAFDVYNKMQSVLLGNNTSFDSFLSTMDIQTEPKASTLAAVGEMFKDVDLEALYGFEEFKNDLLESSNNVNTANLFKKEGSILENIEEHKMTLNKIARALDALNLIPDNIDITKVNEVKTKEVKSNNDTPIVIGEIEISRGELKKLLYYIQNERVYFTSTKNSTRTVIDKKHSNRVEDNGVTLDEDTRMLTAGVDIYNPKLRLEREKEKNKLKAEIDVLKTKIKEYKNDINEKENFTKANKELEFKYNKLEALESLHNDRTSWMYRIEALRERYINKDNEGNYGIKKFFDIHFGNLGFSDTSVPLISTDTKKGLVDNMTDFKNKIVYINKNSGNKLIFKKLDNTSFDEETEKKLLNLQRQLNRYNDREHYYLHTDKAGNIVPVSLNTGTFKDAYAEGRKYGIANEVNTKNVVNTLVDGLIKYLSETDQNKINDLRIDIFGETMRITEAFDILFQKNNSKDVNGRVDTAIRNTIRFKYTHKLFEEVDTNKNFSKFEGSKEKYDAYYKEHPERFAIVDKNGEFIDITREQYLSFDAEIKEEFRKSLTELIENTYIKPKLFKVENEENVVLSDFANFIISNQFMDTNLDINNNFDVIYKAEPKENPDAPTIPQSLKLNLYDLTKSPAIKNNKSVLNYLANNVLLFDNNNPNNKSLNAETFIRVLNERLTGSLLSHLAKHFDDLSKTNEKLKEDIDKLYNEDIEDITELNKKFLEFAKDNQAEILKVINDFYNDTDTFNTLNKLRTSLKQFSKFDVVEPIENYIEAYFNNMRKVISKKGTNITPLVSLIKDIINNRSYTIERDNILNFLGKKKNDFTFKPKEEFIGFSNKPVLDAGGNNIIILSSKDSNFFELEAVEDAQQMNYIRKTVLDILFGALNRVDKGKAKSIIAESGTGINIPYLEQWYSTKGKGDTTKSSLDESDIKPKNFLAVAADKAKTWNYSAQYLFFRTNSIYQEFLEFKANKEELLSEMKANGDEGITEFKKQLYPNQLQNDFYNSFAKDKNKQKQLLILKSNSSIEENQTFKSIPVDRVVRLPKDIDTRLKKLYEYKKARQSLLDNVDYNKDMEDSIALLKSRIHQIYALNTIYKVPKTYKEVMDWITNDFKAMDEKGENRDITKNYLANLIFNNPEVGIKIRTKISELTGKLPNSPEVNTTTYKMISAALQMYFISLEDVLTNNIPLSEQIIFLPKSIAINNKNIVLADLEQFSMENILNSKNTLGKGNVIGAILKILNENNFLNRIDYSDQKSYRLADILNDSKAQIDTSEVKLFKYQSTDLDIRKGDEGKGKGSEVKGDEVKGDEGKGKGDEVKGDEVKGNEVKGNEGKGSEGKGSEGKGSEGKGSEGKGSEGKGSEGKGSEGKGNIIIKNTQKPKENGLVESLENNTFLQFLEKKGFKVKDEKAPKKGRKPGLSKKEYEDIALQEKINEIYSNVDESIRIHFDKFLNSKEAEEFFGNNWRKSNDFKKEVIAYEKEGNGKIFENGLPILHKDSNGYYVRNSKGKTKYINDLESSLFNSSNIGQLADSVLGYYFNNIISKRGIVNYIKSFESVKGEILIDKFIESIEQEIAEYKNKKNLDIILDLSIYKDHSQFLKLMEILKEEGDSKLLNVVYFSKIKDILNSNSKEYTFVKEQLINTIKNKLVNAKTEILEDREYTAGKMWGRDSSTENPSDKIVSYIKPMFFNIKKASLFNGIDATHEISNITGSELYVKVSTVENLIRSIVSNVFVRPIGKHSNNKTEILDIDNVTLFDKMYNKIAEAALDNYTIFQVKQNIDNILYLEQNNSNKVIEDYINKFKKDFVSSFHSTEIEYLSAVSSVSTEVSNGFPINSIKQTIQPTNKLSAQKDAIITDVINSLKEVKNFGSKNHKSAQSKLMVLLNKIPADRKSYRAEINNLIKEVFNVNLSEEALVYLLTKKDLRVNTTIDSYVNDYIKFKNGNLDKKKSYKILKEEAAILSKIKTHKTLFKHVIDAIVYGNKNTSTSSIVVKGKVHNNQRNQSFLDTVFNYYKYKIGQVDEKMFDSLNEFEVFEFLCRAGDQQGPLDNLYEQVLLSGLFLKNDEATGRDKFTISKNNINNLKLFTNIVSIMNGENLKISDLGFANKIIDFILKFTNENNSEQRGFTSVESSTNRENSSFFNLPLAVDGNTEMTLGGIPRNNILGKGTYFTENNTKVDVAPTETDFRNIFRLKLRQSLNRLYIDHKTIEPYFKMLKSKDIIELIEIMDQMHLSENFQEKIFAIAEGDFSKAKKILANEYAMNNFIEGYHFKTEKDLLNSDNVLNYDDFERGSYWKLGTFNDMLIPLLEAQNTDALSGKLLLITKDNPGINETVDFPGIFDSTVFENAIKHLYKDPSLISPKDANALVNALEEVLLPKFKEIFKKNIDKQYEYISNYVISKTEANVDGKIQSKDVTLTELIIDTNNNHKALGSLGKKVFWYNALANFTLLNMEIQDFFSGDASFRKQKPVDKNNPFALNLLDANKRMDVVLKDGESFKNQNNEMAPKEMISLRGETFEYNSNTHMTVAILKDVELNSRFSKEFADFNIRNYKFNLFDASSYCTPEYYKKIFMDSIKTWSKFDNKMFDELSDFDTIITKEHIKWINDKAAAGVFLTFKPRGFYHGSTNNYDMGIKHANDEFSKDYSTSGVIDIKTGTTVLFPALLKDTGFNPLIEAMISQGVDFVAFESAIKSTSNPAITIHTTENVNGNEVYKELKKFSEDGLDFNPNEEFRLNPFFLPVTSIINQVDVVSHDLEQDAGGTQALKNLVTDLDLENKVYRVNNKDLNGKELLSNINELNEKIYRHQAQELLDNMGIEIIDNEVRMDETKAKDFLIRQLDPITDADKINILKSNEIPIEAILKAHQYLSPKLLSLVKKKASNINFNSGSYVQVANLSISTNILDNISKSNILFTSEDTSLNPPLPTQFKHLSPEEVKLFKKSNPEVDLKDIEESNIYFSKDGSMSLKKVEGSSLRIRNAEIMVPFRDLNLNMSWAEFQEAFRNGKIDKEIFENFIGYRIPNQALASNDAITIKGILPPGTSNIAILYHEITGKSGSDYDIDKLYVFAPSYRVKRAKPKLTVQELASFEKDVLDIINKHNNTNVTKENNKLKFIKLEDVLKERILIEDKNSDDKLVNATGSQILNAILTEASVDYLMKKEIVENPNIKYMEDLGLEYNNKTKMFSHNNPTYFLKTHYDTLRDFFEETEENTRLLVQDKSNDNVIPRTKTEVLKLISDGYDTLNDARAKFFEEYREVFKDKIITEMALKKPELIKIYMSDTGIEKTKNDLIKHYLAILKSEASFKNLNTALDSSSSLGFNFIKNIIKEIAKDKPNYNDKIDTFFQQYGLVTSFLNRSNMIKGKNMIAVMADIMTSLGISHNNGLALSTTILNFSNLTKGDFNVTDIPIDKLKIDGTEEEISVLKLSQIVSFLMNSSVDVAKDAYIVDGNINTQTAASVILMIRLGMNPKDVIAFFMSDTMQQIALNRENMNSLGSNLAFNNTLEDIHTKYASNLIYEMGTKKFSDIFNYDVLIKNKKINIDLTNEQAIAGAWYIIENMAKIVGDTIQITKGDAKGLGKNRNDGIRIINLINRLNSSKGFINASVMINGDADSPISTKFQPNPPTTTTGQGHALNNALLARIPLSQLFIEYTDGYINLVNDILKNIGRPYSTSTKVIEQVTKSLDSYFITKVYDPMLNYRTKNSTPQEVVTQIYNKLLTLRQEFKSNNINSDVNEFFDSLLFSDKEGKILLQNKLSLTTEEIIAIKDKLSLINTLDTMSFTNNKGENVSIEGSEIVDLIFDYVVLKNKLSSGPESLYELIPESYLYSKGIATKLQTIRKEIAKADENNKDFRIEIGRNDNNEPIIVNINALDMTLHVVLNNLYESSLIRNVRNYKGSKNKIFDLSNKVPVELNGFNAIESALRISDEANIVMSIPFKDGVSTLQFEKSVSNNNIPYMIKLDVKSNKDYNLIGAFEGMVKNSKGEDIGVKYRIHRVHNSENILNTSFMNDNILSKMESGNEIFQNKFKGFKYPLVEFIERNSDIILNKNNNFKYKAKENIKEENVLEMDSYSLNYLSDIKKYYPLTDMTSKEFNLFESKNKTTNELNVEEVFNKLKLPLQEIKDKYKIDFNKMARELEKIYGKTNNNTSLFTALAILKVVDRIELDNKLLKNETNDTIENSYMFKFLNNITQNSLIDVADIFLPSKDNSQITPIEIIQKLNC